MITFKIAKIKDADMISTLVNSAYRGESSKAGWTTEADLLGGQRTDAEKIRQMIATDRIELAFHHDELVGCVYLRMESEALYFGMLTIRPTLQNNGLGKLLLKRVDEIARELRLKKIRMTVINSRYELIQFYERRGFIWNGQSEPFPENDPSFGIPKTKLIFHVFEKILSE
jgi:N-acetylglutamate synthase-like GNAT family acetyltransferase